MEPDPDGAAVLAYWAEFCEVTGASGEPVDVFAFGDSEAMADELLRLVLAGTKRATAGALRDYVEEGVELPTVGSLSVVLDGRGEPRAVVETTEVRVGALSTVDDAFAFDEGEGDRTRDGWVAAHRAFFDRWFAATGRPAEDDPPLVFERFALRYPVAGAGG